MLTLIPFLMLLLPTSLCFQENFAYDEDVVYQTQIHTITKTEYLPYTASATSVVQPKNVFINQHNHYRSKHRAKKLLWSDSLHEHCKAFIETEFICDGNIHHSQEALDGDIGEIVTIGYSSVEEFMQSIYATKESFDFDNYTDIDSTRSKYFKQLVWNDTKLFGCAMVDCGDYFSNLIVCQYDKKPDSETVKDNVFPE
ncbi:hypothetical protein ACO0OL_002420 [Hanseniaspora opuntiae]|uniref:SCP domain-containing protein n=1 Tax=Hanseniaspora opuntiae TaxID=211096 RepID=A0A1E5RS03_9ASCO|nr:hypothetical protein AWRI3578_g898 [Hanseniaspora opuntiae]